MKTRYTELQKSQQAIEKDQANLARHLYDVKASKVSSFSQKKSAYDYFFSDRYE
jgi:hypothetical protein